MKKITLLSVLSLFVFSFTLSDSAVGKMFPKMVCENYEGKSVELPTTTKGKITLIGIASSKKAEADLKTWIDPIYNTFIPSKKQKDEKNPFDPSALLYDVNLYFVPMFTGANKAMSKSAKQKIKEQSDSELYPYLLFYEGDDDYKESLSLTKKDVPYFFVLDNTGKVVYVTDGAYSEKKLDEIIEIVTN